MRETTTHISSESGGQTIYSRKTRAVTYTTASPQDRPGLAASLLQSTPRSVVVNLCVLLFQTEFGKLASISLPRFYLKGKASRNSSPYPPLMLCALPVPLGISRTLFDLNIKDVSQCVMPGVKKSNDVELQLHESDATDQTEVGTQQFGRPYSTTQQTFWLNQRVALELVIRPWCDYSVLLLFDGIHTPPPAYSNSRFMA